MPPETLSGLPVRRVSLSRRLIFGAAIWSIAILVITAWVLVSVNRAQTLQLLDDELDATLVTLSRAVAQADEGQLSIRNDRLPIDRRFLTPLSGRYWAIVSATPTGNVLDERRSASLWDGELPGFTLRWQEVLDNPGQVINANAFGPNGEPVRVSLTAIRFADSDAPVIVLAAADRSRADRMARQFLYAFAGGMAALAAGLIGAVVVLVRIGLRPLSRIERDLAGIRAGEKERLDGDYPAEVLPLTLELNKLLDHNREVVDRARTHVGNLAHALKTPIAVLMNEARGDDAFSALVRRQTRTMQDNVQHYLKRAQAAARAQVLGARTPVSPTLEGLARTLTRLFERRGISVKRDGTPGQAIAFRGEKQDLEEMAGNLLENACKWASQPRGLVACFRGC